MNSLTYFASKPHIAIVYGWKYICARIRLHRVGHDFKIGDVFCQRGGFVQDYYQVVALNGKTGIELHAIAMFIRPRSEYTCELKPNIIPAHDHFIGRALSFSVKVRPVWLCGRVSFEPIIDAPLGCFLKNSGGATVHPYVPGFPYEFKGDVAVKNSPTHKRFPGFLEPIVVSPATCIVTPDFDAFIKSYEDKAGARS